MKITPKQADKVFKSISGRHKYITKIIKTLWEEDKITKQEAEKYWDNVTLFLHDMIEKSLEQYK